MVAAINGIIQTRNVPGPRGHFLFGSSPELVRDPLLFYSKMRREYGDVVRMRALPTFYWYLISHPSGAERILQTNQQNYPKGDVFNKPIGLMLGQGMLTSEGEFWRRQRRLAQPAFHRGRIAALGKMMTDATEAMLERWREYEQSGQPFDVSAEMTRLTLKIAGQTLLSVDVSGEANKFGVALRSAFEHVNYKMIYPFALPEYVPTARNRRFIKSKRVLDDVVYNVIRERRRSMKDTGDLLSMLLLARDEETGEGMNDEQLRDEVLTILVAGHETGAAALAWVWYLLVKHPDVATKLDRELDEVLKGRTPTIEDLPNLPYTKMVMDETMRLYPPVWGLPRMSLNEDEIGGHRIPAKSLVVVCQYVTHRHPDFWEDPEKFDPERFSPERASARPRFAYFPFGGGARQCIGNNFALMEAQLILATVAQRCRMRLVPEHKVEVDPTSTMRPRNGIMMTLQSCV